VALNGGYQQAFAVGAMLALTASLLGALFIRTTKQASAAAAH
jgi:hypothetical protein